MRSWPRSSTLLSASFGMLPSLGEERRNTALTRSTKRRCENGLRIKSSAPIFRPNSSSISSSFDIKNGEIGWRGLKAVERGSAVGVGGDAIAFGLESNRNRGEDIAVVVDESDCRHGGLLT